MGVKKNVNKIWILFYNCKYGNRITLQIKRITLNWDHAVSNFCIAFDTFTKLVNNSLSQMLIHKNDLSGWFIFKGESKTCKNIKTETMVRSQNIVTKCSK